MTRCFTNRHPFKIRGKACVCGTPLSCRITEPLSNCCSHNPSPLESSKKKKHEVHVDVCAVAVTVLVVVVVVVDMVSAVVVLCVICGCHVSIVMSSMWLSCHWSHQFCGFSSIDLIRSRDTYVFWYCHRITWNFPTRVPRVQKKKNLSWKSKDIQSGATPWISTTLCTKASSKNNPQKKPGFSSSGNSSSRVIWEASGNWSGSSTKVITTVLRKLRDTATRTVLKERRTRFKSISEFVECHETSSTRTRSGWPKYRHKWTSCKIDIAPIPLPTIWERKVYPTRSAKHRGAPSKKCATLNFTNLAKHSEQLNAHRAWSIPKNVYCLCGVCLMPSPEQTEKDQQSKRLRVKSTIHHKRRSIWRTGPQQWQYDLWKATDATTAVRRRHS